MFAKILGKLEQAALSKALRKGELRCPYCGAPHAGPPVNAGEWLTCPECAQQSTTREWIITGGVPRGWVNRPPQNTRIRRQTREDGAIRWLIPASGKSGGFLLFGIFWCTITGVVSTGFVAALLFGKPAEGPNSLPPWAVLPFVLLFFGIFWAIGLGMLYFAARNKWGKTEVRVTGDEVVLLRTLFRWKLEKRLPRHEVDAVRAEEFYRSNEKPVYGVTIQAGKRKLKFGTMLREEEKGWLAADLKQLLSGEPEHPAHSVNLQPPGMRMPSGQAFSLPIPHAVNHLWPIAVLLTLIGLGFVAIGIFVLEGGHGVSDEQAPAAVRVFDMIFQFFDQGFRVIWLLISSVMALGGIAMTARLLRNRHVERKLEGDAAVVAIRKLRNGRVLSEKVFPRGEVRDLSTASSGNSNGNPMNRIELHVGTQTHTLAHWVDAAAAEHFVAEAHRFLWQ